MPPLPASPRLPFDDDPSLTQPAAAPASSTSRTGSAPGPGASDAPGEPLPATYDAALLELERLVGAMEAGKLPLEQLLVSYRRGADLLDFCRGRLESVEQQVKVLDEGRLKPWVDA